MSKLTRNVRIHKLRIFNTVRTDKVQRCIDKVCRQRNVFLARKNFLDTAVIIEVNIPIFELFHISINIAAPILNIPKILEKQRKFLSCHFESLYNGKEHPLPITLTRFFPIPAHFLIKFLQKSYHNLLTINELQCILIYVKVKSVIHSDRLREGFP